MHRSSPNNTHAVKWLFTVSILGAVLTANVLSAQHSVEGAKPVTINSSETPDILGIHLGMTVAQVNAVA